MARGDALVFLDAHCECVVGWMEPLMARIKESRNSVLVPIIDVIDSKDFHYSVNGYRQFQVGGWTEMFVNVCHLCIVYWLIECLEKRIGIVRSVFLRNPKKSGAKA